MINIKEFRVDKIILLITIIRRMKLPQYEKNPKFSKIFQVANCFTNHPDLYKTITTDSTLINDLSPILQKDSFQNIYKDALSYKDEVVKRWEKLEPAIRNYYTNILGLRAEKDIIANIVNPQFNTGTNDMKNEIFYAHIYGEKDISYDATYMMHESLHCLFPRTKEWTDEQYSINHSLIELAIDNELRARLGGNNKNYTEGHRDAKKIRNALMPLWVTFLSTKDGISGYNIPNDKTFKKYMNIAQNNNVQNMNFEELMKYSIEHYKEYGLTENTFNLKRKESYGE